jgi:hypothetical protein
LDSGDFDIPNWLAEVPTEPALPDPLTGPPSPAAESPYAVDVPGWLEDIASPPGLEAVDAGEDESAMDVPDWLATITPPVSNEVVSSPAPGSAADMPAWDAPDWLRPEPTAQTGAEEEPATTPDTSGWFAQGEGLPALDWLFQDEPASSSAPETETPQESPDWIFDDAAPPPAHTLEPPETTYSSLEEARPFWLDSPPGSTSAEAATETVPDWLTNFQPVA